MNIDTREITLEPADNARLLALCGPFDDNIKQLERRLGIEINRRDNHFKLTGRALCVHAAADILRSLYVDTAPMRGQIQDIEPEQIHLAIKEARVLEQSAESVPEYGKAVNIKTKRGVIKPRTPNQAQYIANILDHDITFGVGPAGTGKTYLAVAAAVDALERQEIRRILLTRPAVEAGEKLGFLPGDLSQKVDPYLRMPIVIWWLYPPAITRTPNAPQFARQKLDALGPLSLAEKITLAVFILLLCLWAGVPAMLMGSAWSVNPTSAALIGLSILLMAGVLSWDDILKCRGAWDTIVWFAALVMMADFLSKLGCGVPGSAMNVLEPHIPTVLPWMFVFICDRTAGAGKTFSIPGRAG